MKAAINSNYEAQHPGKTLQLAVVASSLRTVLFAPIRVACGDDENKVFLGSLGYLPHHDF